MSLRLWSAPLAALVLSLAGCPEPTVTPDAAVRSDAFVMPGEDAPSFVDAPSADDAFVVATDDTGTPMADAFTPPTGTWGGVHTALQTNCTPCHASGRSGGHSMAQSDEMMAYMDSQLAAGACAGVTKGACAAMRVRAGSMPPGGLPEPTRTQVADLLDGWVSAGQPAP